LRVEVQSLRESFHFIAEERAGFGLAAEVLAGLRRAIIKRQTIRFDYIARRGTAGTESNQCPRLPSAASATARKVPASA
jgi:hypothetical protein